MINKGADKQQVSGLEHLLSDKDFFNLTGGKRDTAVVRDRLLSSRQLSSSASDNQTLQVPDTRFTQGLPKN